MFFYAIPHFGSPNTVLFLINLGARFTSSYTQQKTVDVRCAQIS